MVWFQQQHVGDGADAITFVIDGVDPTTTRGDGVDAIAFFYSCGGSNNNTWRWCGCNSICY